MDQFLGFSNNLSDETYISAASIAMIVLAVIFAIVLIIMAVIFKRKRDARKAEEKMIRLNTEYKARNEPEFSGISMLGGNVVHWK